MNKTILSLCLFAAAGSTAARAQLLDLSHLDRLADKTDQVVNVKLDEGLIRLASSFLKGGGSELEDVRKILPGIRGIYVRSFEFQEDGVYSQADVDKIDQQLKGWSTVLEVREGKKKEYTKIMMKSGASDGGGLVLVNAAPRELTVVNISGTLTAEQLEKLGGHLGIPEIDVKSKKSKTDKPDKKDDEE